MIAGLVKVLFRSIWLAVPHRTVRNMTVRHSKTQSGFDLTSYLKKPKACRVVSESFKLGAPRVFEKDSHLARLLCDSQPCRRWRDGCPVCRPRCRLRLHSPAGCRAFRNAQLTGNVSRVCRWSCVSPILPGFACSVIRSDDPKLQCVCKFYA
jgi:hypothetical protein